MLDEPSARFYAACVVSALAALHRLGNVFRDLKPENLLIDRDGYLKICDFGFAKKIGLEPGARTYTCCGTAEYVSPELIGRAGAPGWCNFATDYWCLGVLMYECLQGATPFAAADGVEQGYTQTYSRIRQYAMEVSRGADPEAPLRARWAVDESRQLAGVPRRSEAVKALVAQLLHPDPGRRLAGDGETTVLRAQPWFADIDSFSWDALEARTLPPPWRPKVADTRDASNFDADDGAAPCEPSTPVACRPSYLHCYLINRILHRACQACAPLNGF